MNADVYAIWDALVVTPIGMAVMTAIPSPLLPPWSCANAAPDAPSTLPTPWRVGSGPLTDANEEPPPLAGPPAPPQ